MAREGPFLRLFGPRGSPWRRRLKALPVIGFGLRLALAAFWRLYGFWMEGFWLPRVVGPYRDLTRWCTDLPNRFTAARDAAAVAIGGSLATKGRRLLLVPYRAEHVEMPPLLRVGGQTFDVAADLAEFTGLAPALVRTLIARRVENFRTEWLQWPAETRTDHWFYLSSRTYLFGNAGHFYQTPVIVDAIAEVLPEGAKVLEFGGGTGNLALALAARGFRVHYRELSALQKDFTRFRAERYGLEDRVEILDSWTELATAEYDAVCAFDVLEHLPDLPLVVQQLAASLVDKGVLLDTPSFSVNLSNPMHHEDPGLERLLGEHGVVLERTMPDFRIWVKHQG